MKKIILPTQEEIKSFISMHMTLIASVLSIPILIILCIYLVANYFSQNSTLDSLTQEVGRMRKETQAIKQNKQLLEDNIDEYNKILTNLIPETEDYFTIIYALEEISRKTGFAINRYEINIGHSTSEKVAMDVSGNGDANTFMNFLQNYRFEGNRLITNEKIQYTVNEFGGTQVSLNFYNKKLTIDKLNIPNITADKVAFMKSIKDKISYVLASPDAVASVSSSTYETKSNPF